MNVTDMAKLSTLAIGREYRWYAVYTRLNHEKSVEKSLLDQNIEAYLPTIKTLHTWSDRKKWIETPLFKSYVFVRVSNKEYFRVLHISSVLNYICFGGQASVIPDKQIEMVKKILTEEMECEVSNRFYEPRELVQITSGPLAGQQGEVVKCDGKHNMLLRIDHLSHSLMVRIKSSSFRKISLITHITN
ncbi:MAG: UpxY family transcription antiterminator [Bacteroidota bacterium]